MKNQHKYFRNQKYKQKLEAHAFARRRYWDFVYYKVFTKEAPTNIPAEIDYRGNIRGVDYWYEEADARYEFFTPLRHKPDVPYCVREYLCCHKGGAYKTWLKKYRNRQLRRNNRDWVSSSRSDYKKLYEYWWNID